MPFGQLVIGPPGSGKSTFCHGMQQFLGVLERKVVLVNLDPANEYLPYDCTINISDVISVQEVMESRGLGPNGALLYCLEHVEQHIDWLLNLLEPFANEEEEFYIIFDLPGQVELFTCHSSLLSIIRILERRLHFRLTVVNLVDAIVCFDAGRYIAVLLLTLKSMMLLGCPQVNVLSKIDLLRGSSLSSEDLPLPLSSLVDVVDLSNLFAAWEEKLGTRIASRFRRLNDAICELVEDHSLISFIPLAVEDKECMAAVLAEIDKANGFVFGGLTAGNESIMETAMTPLGRDRAIKLAIDRYLSPQTSNHDDGDGADHNSDNNGNSDDDRCRSV